MGVILLKGCLLLSKCALLTLPGRGFVLDMQYPWSCMQAICPEACTQLGGKCMSNGDTCYCYYHKTNVLILVPTTLTSLLLFLLGLLVVASTAKGLAQTR